MVFCPFLKNCNNLFLKILVFPNFLLWITHEEKPQKSDLTTSQRGLLFCWSVKSPMEERVKKLFFLYYIEWQNHPQHGNVVRFAQKWALHLPIFVYIDSSIKKSKAKINVLRRTTISRSQDPERSEADRIREGSGDRGEDVRPVHVLLRPRGR